MAFVLQYARIVPLAIRISLAGGAAYGTVKVGAWSESTEGSREKLHHLKESWQNAREIEYPPVPTKTETPGGEPLATSVRLPSPLRTSLVNSWNSAVTSVCHSLVSVQSPFHSKPFSSSWRKMVDTVRQWTENK